MFIPRLIALATLTLMAHGAAQANQDALPPLIRLVVPFTPGASTDVFARRVAHQLSTRLGTQVVVDNRAGASGTIGSSAVAKGPKDGSLLLFTSVSSVTAAATMRNLPYNVKTDLVPVAFVTTSPLVIAVASSSDVKTPADLLNAARKRPVSYGTGGVGTIAHLAYAQINRMAKVELKHVPYKGGAPAVTDTIGGILDSTAGAYSTLASQVQGGRLRAIAITSAQPSPSFPNLPTVASAVPGYSVELWTAVFAPKGTSPELVKRLNHEINDIAKSKDMQELMRGDGASALSLTPQEASARVNQDYDMWKKLASTQNIVLE